MAEPGDAQSTRDAQRGAVDRSAAGSPADPNAPELRAGRHKPSIILFIVLTFAVLGVDLLVKHLAFRDVADEPIVLSRDPDTGLTVVQVELDDGELITLEPIHPGEPATAIPQHEGVTVIPYVFKLKLTINTGAVFGIGKGKQWLFVLVSLGAIVFISYVFYRTPANARVSQICLALILGGALGNLYDRMLYNGVRDMCYLFPGVKLPFGWTWFGQEGADELYPWIFNIADAALVVGVITLFIAMWISDRAKAAEAKAKGKPVKA